MSSLAKQEVLFPPQIETEPYQLIIRIFKGENIKAMNTGTFSDKKTDCKFSLEYSGATLWSNIVVDLTPTFNEEFKVYYFFPFISIILNVNCNRFQYLYLLLMIL